MSFRIISVILNNYNCGPLCQKSSCQLTLFYNTCFRLFHCFTLNCLFDLQFNCLNISFQITCVLYLFDVIYMNNMLWLLSLLPTSSKVGVTFLFYTWVIYLLLLQWHLSNQVSKLLASKVMKDWLSLSIIDFLVLPK